jgi:uncharacterized protein YbjT (DUF2867 family)
MKVIIFGATGMVGQGALIECLADPRVTQVLLVTRRPTGRSHEKLREVVHADFLDYGAIEAQLRGYDACFFCLGVSAAGMSEAQYRRVTYDFTLAAARTLARLSPGMRFIYVSGMGTDSTEKGRAMWARVKGKTENDLRALPFRAAYMFRPGFIQPLKGVTSGTALYRVVYAVLGPLYPLLRVLAPRSVTTSENVGKAMIRAGLAGYEQPILENSDINRLALAQA